MNAYKTNKQKIAGTSLNEVNRVAKTIFNQIKNRTKRTPYIRAKYFRKEKVFLTLLRKIKEQREKI